MFKNGMAFLLTSRLKSCNHTISRLKLLLFLFLQYKDEVCNNPVLNSENTVHISCRCGKYLPCVMNVAQALLRRSGLVLVVEHRLRLEIALTVQGDFTIEILLYCSNLSWPRLWKKVRS